MSFGGKTRLIRCSWTRSTRGGAGRAARRSRRQLQHQRSGPAADLQPAGGSRSYGIAVGATDLDGRRASASTGATTFAHGARRTAGNSAGVVVALPAASQFDETSLRRGTAKTTPTTATSRERRSRRRGRRRRGVDPGGEPELTNYQVADILKQSASRTTERRTGPAARAAASSMPAPRSSSRQPPSFCVGRDAEHHRRGLLGARRRTGDVADREEPDIRSALGDKRVGDRDFKVKALGDVGAARHAHGIRPVHDHGKTVHLPASAGARSPPRRTATPSTTRRSPSRSRFHIAKAAAQGPHVEAPSSESAKGRPAGAALLLTDRALSRCRRGPRRSSPRRLVAHVDDVQHLVDERARRRVRGSGSSRSDGGRRRRAHRRPAARRATCPTQLPW